MDDLENLLQRAKEETNPQARAALWGECILYVLSLEDVREGLTFDEISAMSDHQASQLADHMQAVFEMRSSWRDAVADSGTDRRDILLGPCSTSQVIVPINRDRKQSRGPIMSTRKEWPNNVAIAILTKCHMRCCVCPEHRRMADIHHIDGNNSNSIEANGVALCKSCHTDAHTTSTMQRNLQPDHLREFKSKWEQACEKLAAGLIERGLAITNVYYMNVHRLDALLRELCGESLVPHIPHPPLQRVGAYNTLWPHDRNTLSWTQLLENRSYFESCLKDVLRKIRSVDLNLLEVGAVDANESIGGLVSFDCQFIGRDIPDQNELIENCGRIEGPPPTMRRELVDSSCERIVETCMMLDPLYMYADSSFLQFSEDGVWSGLARLTKFRGSVGSHDGHMLRDQFVLTPICIGTSAKSARISTVQSGNIDPEQQYLKLLEDQQIVVK